MVERLAGASSTRANREEALTQLRDEFWERGYAATSLDDLMKATGLGKGSLYLAFGDKHQLFLEVFVFLVNCVELFFD